MFSIVVLLSILASCAGKPARHPLSVEVPDRFSSSGDSPLSAKWWEDFEDPALGRLIEQALSNNFSLKSAWARLSQSEAILQKDGATRFPNLELQGSASRTKTRGPAGTLNTGQQSRSFKRFFLGLTTSYELDLWGRISSIQDAAELDLKASHEALQAAAITLTSEVALTWFRLKEAYGQLELLNKQLATNEQVLELVTFRFRRGQVGATDVLQQRQLIESNQGDIASARSGAKVLEHQLAVLLGRPPTTPVSAEPPRHVPSIPPLPRLGVPLAVIQRRPDIRSAYYNLLAADRRVAVAISNRFPRISLSAQINTSGSSARDLFDNWLTTLAANLTGPVIDGGNRRAEVARTQAVVSEKLNDYRQILLEALVEAENALVQEQQQQALLESLKKQLALSRQVLRQTRDNYRQGAADYLRILDVLLTQQALERSLLQARREALVFRVNLYRAIGGGWDMTGPALLPPNEDDF